MKTRREKKDEVSAILIDAFETWRKDMIAMGVPYTQANSAEFCRTYDLPPTSWSAWIRKRGTRLPDPVDNIPQLAEISYVGERIYDAMGMPKPAPEHMKEFVRLYKTSVRFRYIVDHWDDIPEERQEAILDFFKGEEGGDKPELAPA